MTDTRGGAGGGGAEDAAAVLDRFVAGAVLEMRRRLDHGARKFGALSWREQPYRDDDNTLRLWRAIEHLERALENDAGPDELRKRAADVANQAFMYADPERMRDVGEQKREETA